MSGSSNAAANGSVKASELDLAKPKKRSTFPDRILVELLALDLVRGWIDQATEHFEGEIKPSRHDVVNAVLTLHSKALSTDELTCLWKRCFNPVKFLKKAAAQVQSAQARGEVMTLDQVIDRIQKNVAELSPGHVGSRKRGRRAKGEADHGSRPASAVVEITPKES